MKPLPYFESEISAADRRELLKLRSEVTRFLDEIVSYGREAFTYCAEIGAKQQRHADVVLIAFARHILAYMDCIKVLLEQGCSEGTTPLLRSILESYLGIAHIAKEKSEERARSYTLMLARNEINRLRIADKTHVKGQKIHEKLIQTDLYAPKLLVTVHPV
jgi:Family of unknown function (DUF5677)